MWPSSGSRRTILFERVSFSPPTTRYSPPRSITVVEVLRLFSGGMPLTERV